MSKIKQLQEEQAEKVICTTKGVLGKGTGSLAGMTAICSQIKCSSTGDECGSDDPESCKHSSVYLGEE